MKDAITTMASSIVDTESRSAKHRDKPQDARQELRQYMIAMHDEITTQIQTQMEDLCGRQGAMERRLCGRRNRREQERGHIYAGKKKVGGRKRRC